MRKTTTILTMLLLFVGLLAFSLPVFADESPTNPDYPDTQPLVPDAQLTGSWILRGYIKFYDWSSQWVCTLKNATLVIGIDQDHPHKIQSYIYTSKGLCGIPTYDQAITRHLLKTGDGYIGPIVRNTHGVIINYPRISQEDVYGTYCTYDSRYEDSIFIKILLNGRLYYYTDPATGDPTINYIRGTISGWGEFGPARDGETDLTGRIINPSLGQFEGWFVATPSWTWTAP